MIVEVPRWTTGKFEISKELRFNPIVQDTKNGKLRFVNNIFPYHGYIHNYGAIPQTWEDPTIEHKLGKCDVALKGDNDPLDCCEIGSDVLEMGSIKKVKVLGSLALIDDGELDWKVIVIDVNDPLSSKIDDLEKIEEYFPGILDATREWFRKYKVPAGKPLNSFAFHEQYQNSNKTIQTIKECHNSWKNSFQDHSRRSMTTCLIQKGLVMVSHLRIVLNPLLKYRLRCKNGITYNMKIIPSKKMFR